MFTDKNNNVSSTVSSNKLVIEGDVSTTAKPGITNNVGSNTSGEVNSDSKDSVQTSDESSSESEGEEELTPGTQKEPFTTISGSSNQNLGESKTNNLLNSGQESEQSDYRSDYNSDYNSDADTEADDNEHQAKPPASPSVPLLLLPVPNKSSTTVRTPRSPIIIETTTVQPKNSEEELINLNKSIENSSRQILADLTATAGTSEKPAINEKNTLKPKNNKGLTASKMRLFKRLNWWLIAAGILLVLSLLLLSAILLASHGAATFLLAPLGYFLCNAFAGFMSPLALTLISASIAGLASFFISWEIGLFKNANKIFKNNYSQKISGKLTPVFTGISNILSKCKNWLKKVWDGVNVKLKGFGSYLTTIALPKLKFRRTAQNFASDKALANGKETRDTQDLYTFPTPAKGSKPSAYNNVKERLFEDSRAEPPAADVVNMDSGGRAQNIGILQSVGKYFGSFWSNSSNSSESRILVAPKYT